ncbi:citryl-CoA lyase [Ochromonadaceae sp. CCMP2298]|nr:citryl-CoA lyase [Ochromonadaceae sp. CCMP2298]
MSRRLLRSVLFCPGDKQRALAKAVTLPTNAVVFDLEDAVAPDNKILARSTVDQFLRSLEDRKNSPVHIVRVNCPFTTEWGEGDLKMLAGIQNVDAVILPKVEDEIGFDLINSILAENSTRQKPLPIWAMIETARGVLNAAAIARSSSVECLVFGSNDLTKDLRAKHTPCRQPLLYAMSHVILAARAEGKLVLDGVHIELNDPEGLRVSSEQGRNLGFDGKTLIHPSQVAIANAAFAPSVWEVEAARRVVAGWAEAVADGRGVCVVDGRMVEALHVEQARIVLAEACGL